MAWCHHATSLYWNQRVDPDLCRYIASLSHNNLLYNHPSDRYVRLNARLARNTLWEQDWNLPTQWQFPWIAIMMASWKASTWFCLHHCVMAIMSNTLHSNKCITFIVIDIGLFALTIWIIHTLYVIGESSPPPWCNVHNTLGWVMPTYCWMLQYKISVRHVYQIKISQNLVFP